MAEEYGVYEARANNFAKQTSDRLDTLCQIPTSSGEVIADKHVDEIAQCLLDLGEVDASERPRTFAVLHMMNRIGLLPTFKIAGRLDNSFPYPDRRSLPPLMRNDHEASHRFLELQSHILSAACQMEKGEDGPHILAESGDLFFTTLGMLGKGGEA